MPWDLSEFDRKRLEKGRRLLQESEDHRGSRDLQLYVESMDLTVQLHRIFLDDSGERKQGLTAQEKLQGIIVFMRMALCNMAAAFARYLIKKECVEAIEDALTELQESPLPWGGLVVYLASAGSNGLQARHMSSDILGSTVDGVDKFMARPNFSATLSEVELHQRSSGFNPVLSAAEMRLLALYSKYAAARQLMQREPEAPETRQWLAAALSANRQLLQLDPSAAACLHYKQSSLMLSAKRYPEALAAVRSALREAQEHKSIFVEAIAAMQLTTSLTLGFAGPRWRVEEVQGLLRTSKTALAKCKQWMPPEVWARAKNADSDFARDVDAIVAGGPGTAMLPASVGQIEYVGNVTAPECSGCGKAISSLKKCSGCQVAAYCSRACQVQHWKEGGHKQECARLAAGSSGGASSSRS